MIFVKVRMMKTMKTAMRYRRNRKNVYMVLRDFLKETWCKSKRDTGEVTISIIRTIPASLDLSNVLLLSKL